MMEKIYKQLSEANYDFALAIATQAEIDAGAACGQLAILSEDVCSSHDVSSLFTC